MSQTINWYIAPEGTTHHSRYCGLISPWLKYTDEWHFWYRGYWQRFQPGGERAHVRSPLITIRPVNTHKHVHAELIKAWADGAEIQYKGPVSGWISIDKPRWDATAEYRIKPTEPTETKYVPTKKNYQAGIAISQAKYKSRCDKINKKIDDLIAQEKLLSAQYSRKLRVAKALEQGAK